jgi:hypothetical protein
MNIQIPVAPLQRASQILCRSVTSGHLLESTKVRDNGNIVEWHLSNGDIIEIQNIIDYSTGIPETTATNITIYCDGEEQSRISYPSDNLES